jgi:phenylacetate-coenzyme A ligase PaaK-like adenylate-forming protein
VIWANLYLGRSWWGIQPSQRIIQVWGHAHTLGRGLKGKAGSAKRRLKDRMINTVRLNAYKLTPETSRAYYETIRDNPGSVIVSYPSAFRKILDYVEDSGIDAREARVETVIMTSERIDPVDVARTRRLFGAQVVSEYGMAETGCIAYSHDTTFSHRIFWDSVILSTNAGGELSVTTISERCFPLIRYVSGDCLERQNVAPEASVQQMGRVLGRSNDCVDIPLKNGSTTTAHSSLLTRIILEHREIRSFLVRQRSRDIEFQLMIAGANRPEDYRHDFAETLRQAFPDIEDSCLKFSALSAELKTAAGKHRVIVKES